MFLRLTDDQDQLDAMGGPRSVEVYGVEIGDEPVDVSELLDEHKANLAANPCFVVVDPLDHDGNGKKGGSRGRGKKAPVASTIQEDPRRAEIVAQLEGLEVEFDPNADTDALEAALDAATAPTED